MADPVIHLGGSLTRFTWEWRLDSVNTWTLTVSAEGEAATIAGAVVLELEGGGVLAGTIDGGSVVWTVGPDSVFAPPVSFASASIVNLTQDSAGDVVRTVWARGLVYVV